VPKSDSLALTSDQDIVVARQAVRKIARELKFSIVDQTKLITAASELARNALLHGGGGTLVWEIVQNNGKSGLQLTVTDKGPGIENVALAMKDGYSSGSGLGMGLPGTKRLVNEFRITSSPGLGTTVVVTRWK